jgi:hypothetical protein
MYMYLDMYTLPPRPPLAKYPQLCRKHPDKYVYAYMNTYMATFKYTFIYIHNLHNTLMHIFCISISFYAYTFKGGEKMYIYQERILKLSGRKKAQNHGDGPSA